MSAEMNEPDISDLMMFGNLKVSQNPDALRIWAAYRESKCADKATFYRSLLQLVTSERASAGHKVDQAKLAELAEAKRLKREEEERARKEKLEVDNANLAKQVTEAAEAVMRAQKRKEEAARKAEEEAAQAAALKKKEEAAREKEEAALKEEEQRLREAETQKLKAKVKEEKAAAEKKKRDDAAAEDEHLEKAVAIAKMEKEKEDKEKEDKPEIATVSEAKNSKGKGKRSNSATSGSSSNGGVGSGGGSNSAGGVSSGSNNRPPKIEPPRPGEADMLDSDDEADMKEIEALDLSLCKKRVAASWTELPPNGDIYEGEVVRIPKGNKKGSLIRHGKGISRRLKNGEMVLEMNGTFEKHCFVRGIIKQQGVQGGQVGFSYTGQVLNKTFHGKGNLKVPKFAIKIGSSFFYSWFISQNTKTQTHQISPLENPPKRDDGRIYSGNFFEGDFDGKGKYTSDKIIYEGLYHRGDFCGQGKLTDLSDDTISDGEWREGKLHGFATRSNSSYESKGHWIAGKLHGKGLFKDKGKKGAEYEGEFRDNMYHGKGTLKEGNTTFEGGWKEGLLDGQVTMTFSQGDNSIVVEGQWNSGKPLSPAKVTREGKQEDAMWENGSIVIVNSGEVITCRERGEVEGESDETDDP